ncbi:hypothetical protein G3554_22830 [Micromonospora sp. PPF5-17]|uniref:MYXO-CTERM domain-containing protein n=2 Tax=Micromonosporaceae TaxID=28056 RepID=A0ABX9WAJ3_9ACTN|nr:hypothetical protein [Micromonospora sp. PPF5-17B]NES38965.1 hypothetical protein [Micromonospora solifontis]NES57906.1 hypothetical protein [Micromonospora sp. PPF5-6]RNL92266.1 hypothetical protein EFE23_22920 [Micromonospora solifontis]
MVNLPAARRHHRSRINYALGLLALLGTATALALVVRHPAFSATEQSTEPVPAPEITVVEGTAPPGTAEDEQGWAGAPEDEVAGGGVPTTPDPAGAGAGQGTLADPQGVRDTEDVSRSLFYSGLLGLAISLAGLGLVGTRRRQW